MCGWLAEDITDEDVTSSHALPVLVFISVCGYLFLSLVKTLVSMALLFFTLEEQLCRLNKPAAVRDPALILPNQHPSNVRAECD